MNAPRALPVPRNSASASSPPSGPARPWPKRASGVGTGEKVLVSCFICARTRRTLELPFNPEHDLADVRVGLHVALRRGELVEAEHPVDERLDALRLEQRQEVLPEAAHRAGALLGVAQLVRDAEHAQAARVQRLEVDLGAELAVDIADD